MFVHFDVVRDTYMSVHVDDKLAVGPKGTHLHECACG